jgi:adenylosuccinate lyase
MVQKQAMKAWKGNKDFKELLMDDREVTKHLSGDELEEIFDLGFQLRYVDTIFSRVFKQSVTKR